MSSASRITLSSTRQGLRVTPASGLGVTSASALHAANRCLLACRRSGPKLNCYKWDQSGAVDPERTLVSNKYVAHHQSEHVMWPIGSSRRMLDGLSRHLLILPIGYAPRVRLQRRQPLHEFHRA